MTMSQIERIITPKMHDIGGLFVGRILPQAQRRAVGPFVFLDHMGPASMAAGQAIDVRPHPHIGLSTLTYLYEGEIFHRDSLGNAVEILPGAVNWMTAGRGIAHSERNTPQERKNIHSLHGLQFWVALPVKDEEIEPEFLHYDADAIPHIVQDGAELTVVAGAAYGVRSPVKTYSPLFYVDVRLAAGAKLELPDDYTDRALYMIDGAVEVDGEQIGAHTMAVLNSGGTAAIAAKSDVHLILLGGEPFPEPRHIWWNFVSSSRERIEQAKRDWKERRFGPIPGDDREFIPLPE
jgi:redox-sensitive bicupin YhaK (pirin superfamily)